MRSRYHIKESSGIHFLTTSTVAMMPVFTHPDTVSVLLDALLFFRKNKGLLLYAYVIMDNHIHLVGAAPDLSRCMQALKGYTARQVIALAKSKGREWQLHQFLCSRKSYKTLSKYQVWQEGFHPQLIQSRDMLLQKIQYIHNNPVRRGWVDTPEAWRYSSARNYESGDHSVLEIDPLPL